MQQNPPIRKNLLFILPTQFGYHIDTYSYCKHLNKNLFSIYYICIDQNLPTVKLEYVTVIYIKRKKSKFLNYLNYAYKTKKLIKKNKIDLVFMVHHKFSLLIRIINLNKKFILDIRTGYLIKNSIKRSIYNFTIILNYLFYKKITIISDGLRKKLNIPNSKCSIIPLGAELRVLTNKSFNKLKLLYIGSLNRRNIDIPIRGLVKYIREHPSEKITFDIIGFGDLKTENSITKLITDEKLINIVFFHGRIPYEELGGFYEKCNVGITYIPIVPEYEHQPSTKLFEFLLSGIPVIATATTENIKYINVSNGVIINDSEINFYNGLVTFKKNITQFNSNDIRNSVINYTWSNITTKFLTPILIK